VETASAMFASFELTFCPSCGMPCSDEHLLMCLACGSVYCAQGSCRAVCLCQEEASLHFADRPAKEFFERLVRDNPFAVIIKDAGGRVIHATDGDGILHRQMGFSIRELIGRTNFDLFCQPESTTLNRIEFEVVSRQQPFRFVTNLMTRKGLVHRFMVEVAPYRMTAGDNLTITTLTPASASMGAFISGKNCDLYELQPCSN